uniref:Uncharacterized protein n=1 Tax=Amphilophus citrinellus TaxID=61819 RepID=A0A3Q0S936_AMPCI
LTMAKVDSGVKPLQNAMKMAKVAIQLDGGNRHKVSEPRRLTAPIESRLGRM